MRPRTVLFGSAALAGAASRLLRPRPGPLAPPLGGSCVFVEDPDGGFVATYRTGEGEARPVVLVHSVNAAASAAEMRPLFERLAGERPVVALDLPGYGLSTRGDRPYRPESMAGAVRAVIEDLDAGPVHLVALSLGAEFAARVAAEHPGLVSSLAAISPTGLGERRGPSAGSAGAPGWARIGPLAAPAFAALTSRASIRYFLGKSFAGGVDETLATYAHRTAHADGARFAPFTFLAGRLFSPDAFDLYASVQAPSAVLYDLDPFTGFGRLSELEAHEAWEAVRIPGTKGLPHFDAPDATMGVLRSLWARAEGGGPADGPDGP